jgi:16S rRNA C967 or C1407 C5-methylase (RsmB/RsmF family)/NOL1/NOP2/fmu family ribosome biogenesis protein
MPQLPSLFIDRIQTQYPSEAASFLASLDNVPSTSIRYNPLKYKGEVTHPIPWAINGQYIEERPIFTKDPLIHAGVYYVQESSSMLIEQFFRQIITEDSPLRVLDLCAAPGGKSTHIASMISEQSYLVSNEIISSRAAVLIENTTKWGSGNIVVTQNDPKHFRKLPSFFDIILIDAPCGGEGMFRKDQNSREEWSESNCNICVDRQRKIVADVWGSLVEGGYMIYSTCTFNPQENEENLHHLQQIFGFECIILDIPAAWNIHTIQYENITMYQTHPHLTIGEGFSFSVLKKGPKTAAADPYIKQKKNLFDYLIQEDKRHLYNHRKIVDKEFILPIRMDDDFGTLASALYIRHAGVCAGEIIKDKILPAHSLAMWAYADRSNYPLVPVSEKNALDYLAKRDFVIDAPIGWCLITYDNHPLGFIKNIGNRFNNYYPMEWRVLKY